MKFRDQALRNLESPEQLDEAARMTSTPGHLATISSVALALSLGSWSIFGTITQTLHAPGVFLHAGGISTLQASQPGQVIRFKARPGEFLRAGDPVYTLRTPTGATTTVEAPWSAVVVDVLVREGQAVRTGTDIADFDQVKSPTEPLDVVAYVPSTAAGISPGTRVSMSITGAPAAQGGSLHGTVESVDSYPANRASLRATLGDDYDVKSILSSGSVVAVLIKPDFDHPEYGVQARSAPALPQHPLDPVTTRFVVAKRHPINWLVTS